jgi:NADPH2:quinone reductase
VREVAPGVDGFAVGDRVAWAECPGSYAEVVALPAERAVPVPDAVSDEVAVGALLQGMTAHMRWRSTCTPCRPGTTCWCTPRRAGWACCSPSSRRPAAPG